MEPVLEIKGLNKQFDRFHMRDVNLVLPKGYIIGIIGPNGAGKTTTIKLIMNLLRKDSGEIKVFGRDHVRYEKEIKQRIGFVYDENHFYEQLSIDENQRIIAPFYENWDNRVFQDYVRMFELPPRKKVKDLSHGMKTKFALALALAHQAELIIMDEPTSGLDPVFRRELLDILAGLMQDDNRTVIFSTHITSDLERIADYVCFINQGQIVFCDIMDNILEKYRVVKGQRELLDNRDFTAMLSGVIDNRFGFEALTSRGSAIAKAFKDQVMLEKATLDDIILYTVRGNSHAQPVA
ncbi:MAG: ABC transporter ATP-binding protein [Syntrophomonadaceae bacterium]|nr:ABC transporter ATP-binding protein [Syntrophomonadaceae bacterium]